MYQFVLPVRTPNRAVQIAVHCTWLILSRGDGAPIPSRRVSQLLNCPSGLGRGRSHGIILPAVAQRGPTGFDPGRQIICCCCCGRCASPNTFSAPPSNLRSDSHIYFTARKSQGASLPAGFVRDLRMGRPSWTRVGKRLGGDGGGRCHRTSAANGV